jgi:succinate dehydrogenase / fumarate reductase flavoprotein subunit
MSTMQDDVGIFRDEVGLKAAVADLEELERRAEQVRAPSSIAAFNPGWHLCHDLRNMLVVAQAVTRAALLRQESRGAHSRLDYPEYDEYWSEHNILVRQDNGEMTVEPRPVVKAPQLVELVEQRKEAERR